MKKETLSFLVKYHQPNDNSLKILDKEIKRSERKNELAELKILIKIKDFLRKTNKKQIQEIQDQINKISKILEKEIDLFKKLSFSGSILKETYVHGLSDIDIFVLLKKDNSIDGKPKTIQSKIFRILKKNFPSQRIKNNKEAIDFFIKNTKIQIVPILYEKQKISFPFKGGENWRRINPNLFIDLLKKEDKKFKGRITTSIKIIKIILSKYPKRIQINGHHLEVLSYLSCKNLQDKKMSLLELISNILSYVSKRIVNPIKDSSKQFKFVDGYLGKERNLKRKNISKNLEKVLKKLNRNELKI